MVVYNFKRIQVVPSASAFIDITLSKTQRKTPTEVHKGYSISRIRAFYTRKVKFAQQTFHDRLTHILDDFPQIDQLHPFYADLLNVLYDKDHYKLALGQLSNARTIIARVATDYVRLLKYGDSLYRCKALKRAALGRMCTLMKRHNSSLAYLEQVRQHMARLPSIDPATRTLLIAGFPNVGKSSFINRVTRANVDVQPYAFTTKSLFVGHLDYKFLRWQVIDTPGILDKPLEQRNTIEMQSITALAHLRAAVLFFIDPSETCGYTIADQVSLFRSLVPLFANKPLLVVANKTDLNWQSELTPDHRAALDSMLASSTGLTPATPGADRIMNMSAQDAAGVDEVKNAACEMLLAQRVEQKVRTNRAAAVLNRLHVAQPRKRDEKERPANIPASVARAREDAMEMEGVLRPKRRTEKDLMEENGGAGVYSMDYRKLYDLKVPKWAYDIIPEIVDGKNIADFVDPDIEKRLEELEVEEDARLAMLPEEDDEDLKLDEESQKQFDDIREKKTLMKQASKREKGKARSTVAKTILGKRGRAAADVEAELEELGMDSDDARDTVALIKSHSSARRPNSFPASKRARLSADGEKTPTEVVPKGIKDTEAKTKVEKLRRVQERRRAKYGRQGEADRNVYNEMPKHLFSGKRKGGKTDRR